MHPILESPPCLQLLANFQIWSGKIHLLCVVRAYVVSALHGDRRFSNREGILIKCNTETESAPQCTLSLKARPVVNYWPVFKSKVAKSISWVWGPTLSVLCTGIAGFITRRGFWSSGALSLKKTSRERPSLDSNIVQDQHGETRPATWIKRLSAT